MATSTTTMTELTLQVLLALADGPAHGYAIGKDIEDRTEGRLDPTTGSLYQTLRRLADLGLITPVATPRARAGDPRRKYFALTPAGRAAAAAEIRRLEGIVAVGQRRHLLGRTGR